MYWGDYVYLTNPSIDTANDTYTDWNLIGELNSANSPQSVDINTTAIQNYIDTNDADANGFVYVPLNISSDTAGIVQLDALSVKYYSNRGTLILLSDGGHNVTIYANDSAANMGSSTVWFTVDTTPPTITLNLPADNDWTNNNRPAFTFAAIDNIDTSMFCELFIDGTGYGSTSTLNNTLTTITANTSLPDGARSWWVNCTDDGPNTGQSPAWTLNIDTILPQITIESPANTTYATTSVDLTVAASENIDTWRYNLNSAGNTTFTPNTTITGEEGLNNITVYANDVAGNMNSSIVYFSVDLPLQITITSPPNDTTTDNTPDLNLTTDELSNVTYSWDTGGNISGCRNCDSYNTTYGESAPDADTALLMHFNENIGNTTHDDSPNDNDGTLGNSSGGNQPAWTTDGKFGNALSFDGSSDFVEVPDNDTLDFSLSDSFTVETWVKTDFSGVAQYVVGKVDTTVDNWLGYHLTVDTGGKAWFMVHDSTKPGGSWPSNIKSTKSVNDGNWHHVVAVRDVPGGVLRLYVDGMEDATPTDDATSQPSANGVPLRIGTHPGVNKQWFDGTIDEVHVIRRALSTSEIAGIYNRALSDALHSVTVYATDNARNINSTMKWFTVSALPSINITTPPNETIIDVTPDLNFTIGELANETYSWDSEGNISGCRNCDSYNTTYGESVPKEDTSLLMHFNENIGDITYDDSPNSNDGTLGNSSGGNQPVWTTDGKFGNALSFDGSSDFVEVLDDDSIDFNASTDSFTMMAWISSVGSTSKAQYIVNKQNGLGFNPGYHLFLKKTGELRFMIHTTEGSSDYGDIKGTTGLFGTGWRHVAAVYNASADTMDIYVDGNNDSATAPYTPTASSLNNEPLFIGAHDPVDGRYFNGSVDEVVIYNRSLIQSEIQGIYNKTLSAGQHSVTVYATDVEGNQDSTTRYFTIG